MAGYDTGTFPIPVQNTFTLSGLMPPEAQAVPANANGCFGGPHPGVCQFVFCDGSVRPIRNSIDTANLRRLAARNDGEAVTFVD